MTKLTHGTWVLIADGEKALFLRNITDEKNPNLVVVTKEEQENPPAREQGTDKPGRYPDPGPGQRSAVADTDWHQLEEDRFAHDIAEKLYKLAHRGAFDRIVICAAPKALGAIRDALHPEVKARVVAELDKDLTKMPVYEIEKLLTKELQSV